VVGAAGIELRVQFDDRMSDLSHLIVREYFALFTLNSLKLWFGMSGSIDTLDDVMRWNLIWLDPGVNW
jgi:hypothetical protein